VSLNRIKHAWYMIFRIFCCFWADLTSFGSKPYIWKILHMEKLKSGVSWRLVVRKVNG